MTETQVQAPGQFCWCDLSTPNLGAAKDFYSGLFGWKLNDMPAGDSGTYTMAKSGAHDVCGMMELSDELKSKGVPPHWMGYVLVENVDEKTKKASELGATVQAGPFDVMGVGRMSVISDPTGATVSLWQAKSPGATPMGPPNTACWFECISTDKNEAGAFYAALFGWELESFPGGMDYTLFKQGEKSTGGLMQRMPEMGDAPSHWAIYFAVDDCDASAEKAQKLGGKVLHPPTDIPSVGRFAMVCDPTGAMFQIIKLEEQG